MFGNSFYLPSYLDSVLIFCIFSWTVLCFPCIELFYKLNFFIIFFFLNDWNAVMQFGGQHPGGLPAVGMAFPGYVAQPQLGLGNSEMTWYSNSFPVEKFFLWITSGFL